jgi:hypothetical protein
LWQTLNDDSLCRVMRLAGFDNRLRGASRNLQARVRRLNARMIIEFAGEVELAAARGEGAIECKAEQAEAKMEVAAAQYDVQRAARFARDWNATEIAQEYQLEAYAARIDDDLCRRCGRKGHWAAACPQGRRRQLGSLSCARPSWRDPARWEAMAKLLFPDGFVS